MGTGGLFLFLACCMIAAFAADVTHLYAAKAQLQAAADSAAHAALLRRNSGSNVTEAKSAAISVAQFSLPPEVFGNVVAASDILFGSYDPTSDTFQVDPDSRIAVIVSTRRSRGSGNPVASFFFRLVGIWSFDISATAVFSIYEPGCLSQGFSANGVIDIQGGSRFLSGFCMHSNSHIKIAQNNFFDQGNTVSMPDLAKLEIPNSGLTNNPGLKDALEEDYYRIKILDRLRPTSDDPLHVALMTPNHGDRPSYIEPSSAVVNLGTGGSVSYNSAVPFTPGRVHVRYCSRSNDTLTITGPSTGLLLSNFVLITDCPVVLSGKVTLENVLLYTTNTSDTSVQVSTGGGGGNSQGLYIGRPDLCTPGFAAQIFTRGGFKNSAALYMYGSHLVTLGRVVFASNATGEGATVTTDSTISGNSNLLFKACPPTALEDIRIPYFQLVR